MTRQKRLLPSELDADQRALYDAIAGGPRAQGPQAFALTDADGALHGPFNAMLLSPPLGSALQSVGSAARYRSAFADRAREIAILVVAYGWDSAFEIHAHEAVGRRAGLSDPELQALRAGDWDTFTDPVERCVATSAATLTAQHDLTDDEYAAAHDLLGARRLFELTTIVGYYATLALQLRVYRVD